jgi:type I restriction enzyme S subunit
VAGLLARKDSEGVEGIGTIADICEIVIGGDWGNDDYFEDGVEVICLRGVDLENLRASGHSDAPRRFIKKNSLEKRKMDDQDILIAASGLGPLGRSLWMSESFLHSYNLPIIYSNFCKRLRTKKPYYAIYIDRILFDMRSSGEIWEYSTGTALPNLDSDGLLRGKNIIIPPDFLLEKYYQIIKPIIAKLYNQESLLLAALRDALLPKLLSGEIRVKDAERFL